MTNILKPKTANFAGVLFSKKSKKNITYFTGILINGNDLIAFTSDSLDKYGELMTTINIYEIENDS